MIDKNSFSKVKRCNAGIASILYTFFVLLVSNPLAAQDQVVFSTTRGYYNTAFQLALTSTIPGATIRYTTNGSAPTTTSGTVYSSALKIDSTTCVRAIAYSGTTVSKVYTHTYLFLDKILHQPATIPGWPNRTYSTGQGNAVHDYEMDPDIVNSPLYKGSFTNAFLSIPTMSIVMDKDQFWQSYDSPDNLDIENPGSVEVIYPDNPAGSEQVNCGLESHSHLRLKRSLRLKFKSDYGASKFVTKLLTNAPLNGNSASGELDNLILRGGNNRSWARTWNPDRTCYTRDEWYRESQVAISGFGPRGTFVHLYINGLYWGLYNPVERPDHKFSAYYFGGSSDDWFSINHDGIKNGDSARYAYLIDTLINKDLRVQANYDELKNYLDVEDFCDYVIVTWMTGMTDWPTNNFWGGYNTNPISPFHYYTWDCEWSWDVTNGSNEGAWVHPAFRRLQNSGPPIAHIFNAAKKNPNFMLTFADRVQKHCMNNGALNDVNSRQRWATLNNYIKDAIIAESARWGDALNDGVTRTKNTYWLPEVNRVDNLMNGNVNRFITALRNENYFPTTLAPVFSSSGGEVNQGFQLSMSNPNSGGTIYYTLNGSDPRKEDDTPSFTASIYSSPVVLNRNVTVKARIRTSSGWSPLQEATFTIKNLNITGLFINEFLASNTTILTDEFGDKDDWIEIYNSNSQPVDLGGLYITDKLTNKTLWQIPAANPSLTTIPAKGYKILWADEEPNEGILHVNLKLSNGGEQIGLFQILGSDTIVLDQYTFGVQTADISTGRFPDGSNNFITFTQPTPGARNRVNPLAGIFINEFLTGNVTDTTDEAGDHDDWIEIYNAGDVAADIGGLYISDNLSTPGLYQIPSGNPSLTTIPPKSYKLLWADGEPAEGVLHIVPKLSLGGEQIGLFQKFGSEYAVVDSISFKAQVNDISTGRYPDGSAQWTNFTQPTPDGSNILPLRKGLFINEFMASNTKTLKDEQGDYDDWIEIYNSNNVAVDIGGLFITDNVNNPLQYQIPTSSPSLTTIPAHGFVVLWADKQTTEGVRHVDIKLSNDGEQIALVQKNGSQVYFIDSLSFGPQLPDTSQGRLPDAGNIFVTFPTPTPGATNSMINRAPVVNAGDNQTVILPQNSIQLAASASDPDGDPLTYLWKKISGPSCLISDSTHLATEVKNLTTGTYIFRFTATDLKGKSSSDTLTVNVYSSGLISFTLINADTDTDIRMLKLQDTLNLNSLPTTRINIRANTSPAVVGSVIFSLNGSPKTENTAPYSLKGDNNGNYSAWTPATGNYTLTGTTFTGTSGQGTAGKPLTILFVVTNTVSNKLPLVNAGTDQTIKLPQDTLTITGVASDPDGTVVSYTWTKTSGASVNMQGTSTQQLRLSGLQEGTYTFRLTVTDNANATAFDEVNLVVQPVSTSGQSFVSFTLINAATDQDIKVLQNGDVINLASLPTTSLNIRGNTNPATVGSVVFMLNGKSKIENTLPYSLKGDNNGDYIGWTPAIGNYTLTGTPYTLTGGTGVAGTSLTINFRVVNNLAAAMRQEDSVTVKISSEPDDVLMKAYPNPFNESVDIEFTTSQTQYILLEVYDGKGNLEQKLFEGIAQADQKHIYAFDGSRLREGVYFARLTTRNLVRNQRLLLIR